MSIGLTITLVVFSLILAGVLAAAEAAFLYLPRKEAEDLVSKKPKGALSKVFDNPRDHTDALRFWRIWFEFLSAVLVTALFLRVIETIWIALLSATVMMAVVSFVFVGISPRQLGRRYDHQLVSATASLVHILRLVLGPIPQWLAGLGRKLTPSAPTEDTVFFAEEHFMEFVTRASEAEVIEDSEVELIQSVVDLSDTRVRAVMVPRTDMITIDHDATLQQAMSLFLRSGNSRIPVIGEDTDDIRGVLYLKDVAGELFGTETVQGEMTVTELQRAIHFIPESKLVSELLEYMQAAGIHMAIVVDEYGGTAGLVTLEDLIEEIVGEIVDEYDEETPEIEELAPDEQGHPKYRLATAMAVDDFADLVNLRLEQLDYEDVDTLGGLFSQELGKVPLVGSEVDIDHVHLVAERREGRRNRISHVIATVYPLATAETTPQESEHEH
ncbi:hemolysin family protein [Micrococcoides hystricis]|uniref:Hemolysin family protein n=1 Tax=Micrococcoides hystricis TaxID=1572761 RepID=A0ABV6P8V0_9MICC